jgi:endonuclease/exonuclease/phosphatase family metal-dependent hydrolase
VTDGAAITGAGLFGNALLSRHPLTDVRVVALPRAPMDAFVEPPGGDPRFAGLRYADAPPTIREPRCLVLASVDGLRLGTTHFSHRGSGERLLQSEGCVDAFGDASPAVLLGDLNAAIDAPELAPFTSWTDAFAEPPGDPARISTDDGWRIDQVLARGASVSPAQVLRETGDLSDHFPVLVDVTGS